jgi:DNA polymerase III subunit alpha
MADTSGGFVHLHVHTEYSLLDGAIRIKDLIARAKNYDMPAVALTDHGTMFGVMDFYLQAQKAGIKPLSVVSAMWRQEVAMTRHRKTTAA